MFGELIELKIWDELMKQSSWTVGHWYSEAEKYGITKTEDKLKFAEICSSDFRSMSLCRISDEICKKLQVLSESVDLEKLLPAISEIVEALIKTES